MRVEVGRQDAAKPHDRPGQRSTAGKLSVRLLSPHSKPVTQQLFAAKTPTAGRQRARTLTAPGNSPRR
jgi:hypothetical protein